MSDLIADFADMMLTRFPPFRAWEDYQDKAYANDLVAELSGFSAEVIKRAQREIIRTRKPHQPKPPMVSECLTACIEAKRWIEAQESQGKLPALRNPQGDEWSTERVKLAYDLIKSGVGKQAARDNPSWILGLWHFCRKHQRVPEIQEVEKIKRDAREFDESYRKCVTGEVGPLSKVLLKLGDSMLAKREKLRAEVLGQ